MERWKTNPSFSVQIERLTDVYSARTEHSFACIPIQ